MADTIKSDIEESLAPATEELVSWVLEPGGTAVADLVRRFPEAAELLRAAKRFLPDLDRVVCRVRGVPVAAASRPRLGEWFAPKQR